MRIKLFNKKTIYEIYILKTEIGKHQFWDNVDLLHAWITSKEYTLGPSNIDSFVRVSTNFSDEAYSEVREYTRKQIEEELIRYLNNNVGLECLIKKEDVPEEVYNKIKGGD